MVLDDLVVRRAVAFEERGSYYGVSFRDENNLSNEADGDRQRLGRTITSIAFGGCELNRRPASPVPPPKCPL